MAVKAVFCVVQSEAQALRIIAAARDAGFSGNDISALCPDKQGSRDLAHEAHTKAPEGVTAGAVSGGVLGGVAGYLVGIGALAIPGLGAFVAAGPIMASLGGAAAGAVTGGITGMLVGYGVPEYEARRYEGKMKSGNILLSIHTGNGDEVRRAKEIFKEAGAEGISYTGGAAAPSAAHASLPV
jgi:hypothetical protein